MPVKNGLKKEESRDWNVEDTKKKRLAERKSVDIFLKALDKIDKILDSNKPFPSAQITAAMKIADKLSSAKLVFTPSRAIPELKTSKKRLGVNPDAQLPAEPTPRSPVDPKAMVANMPKTRTINPDELYIVDTERIKNNDQ